MYRTCRICGLAYSPWSDDHCLFSECPCHDECMQDKPRGYIQHC